MTNANSLPQDPPTVPPDGETFREFPAEVRWLLSTVWQRLPRERQTQLLGLLEYLPTSSVDGLQKLAALGREQLQIAFGDLQNVAIVGPANVGKSTLYNQFIQDARDQAAVSPVPGTTVIPQRGDGGLFQIVDTPGMDAVGALGAQERRLAAEAAASADFLIILFDAIQGIRESELALFNELRAAGKPYLVVLNKMDLIGKREREGVINRAAANLGLPAGEILPISALKGDQLGQVLVAIAKSEPALLAALGAALPAYRGRLAWQATLQAAGSAAVVAFVPIPIIDFIPLATVQALLVLSIGRIYQYRITPRRARELLGSLGLGYLGRTIFYELSKLGGPPTWIISVAVAVSMTIMVGYAAMLWFERGEKLTAPRLKQLTRALTSRLTERLKVFQRKKPGRRTLAGYLTDVLGGENWPEDLEQPPSQKTAGK